MNIRHLLVATLAFAVPSIAFATPPLTVPEPETIALIGVGAVALMIARWAKRK
jgi:hypothetical protein